MIKTCSIAMMGLALICTNTRGENFDQVFLAVRSLQPAHSAEEASAISRAVESTSRRYRLDWRILLAILMQESSLKRDPQGCGQGHACKDYGIGQANFPTWGKVLHIDRKRVLVDLEYAVDLTGRILEHYRTLYGARERLWFGRYHSGDPVRRREYLQKIAAISDKIDVNLRGFADVRYRRPYHSSYHRQAPQLYAGGDPGAVRVHFRSGGEVRGTVQAAAFTR